MLTMSSKTIIILICILIIGAIVSFILSLTVLDREYRFAGLTLSIVFCIGAVMLGGLDFKFNKIEESLNQQVDEELNKKHELCTFLSDGKTGVIKEEIEGGYTVYYFYINSDGEKQLLTVQKEDIEIVHIAADEKGFAEQVELSKEKSINGFYYRNIKWIVYVPEGMFMTEFELVENTEQEK